MSAQPEIVFTGARWSSAVVCPRRAVYDHFGAPQTEPSDQVKRWRRRGKAVEQAIRGEIISDLRAQNRRPRREEVVPWPASDPLGEGHLDCYVPHTREAIEIKSRAGASLDASAALQVAGYCLNHPNAETAQVVSVDPSSFDEVWYPINVEALIPHIRELEQTVVAACGGGDLPDRVCRHPGEAEGRFCPYAPTCFEGWERPTPDVLLLDAEAVRLADATDETSRLEREAKAAKERRDALRAELRPHLAAGAELETPSIAKLKRTEIAGRQTLSLTDMASAGYSLPAELEPFKSVGKPSERWTVTRREA